MLTISGRILQVSSKIAPPDRI